MYLGPVTVDESKVTRFVSQIPADAVVLELGGGIGQYSVGIRKRIEKLIVIEPDARFVRCILANSGMHGVDVTIGNTWISECKMIMVGGALIESDGTHHTEDEIRNITLKEFQEAVDMTFTHIVANRADFFDQFYKEYPLFVQSCTVLKSYDC